ncbi:BA75_03892T0 [Komagataella pastoris]|uniref:BA75_03892T0 n=1 Tax=Komagataella pastoris TaxID=4922 RepID=A0A1B2JG22_PICPA|nr:BA75_03892T0 [Komagataella pastoris]
MDISSPIRLQRRESSIRGSYKAALEWSYDGENYEPLTIIEITSNGELIANRFLVITSNLQSCSVQIRSSLELHLTTFSNSKDIYLKCANWNETKRLIDHLIVWQNLKPEGILKKWEATSSIVADHTIDRNQLLVCRFKVFGPVPTKNKHVSIVEGPDVPIYPTNNSNVTESWFMAMGALKANGTLELLSESDGSLIFSIDITKLFSSEIRQLDHSIFQNQNCLFLGRINELRVQNTIKTTEPLPTKVKTPPFIIVPDNQTRWSTINRIIIEFPLHIDFEDWFVALNSFARREYFQLDYNNDRLRVSRNVSLDIIDASFYNELPRAERVYGELILWGTPWCRTAIVETKKNIFWKELFQLNLPLSLQYFHVLIKKSKHDDYSPHDETIGVVYVTPDMVKDDHYDSQLSLTIFSNSKEFGKISINLKQSVNYILNPSYFKFVEKVLNRLNPREMIDFIKPLTGLNQDLEEISSIVIDVYQVLGSENAWFAALMESELTPIDSITRNNRIIIAHTANGTTDTDNLIHTKNAFNTLFRGNSILSKSLEKYGLRIGHEYLEKVIGLFVKRLTEEKKDCEVDPRMIEIPNSAEMDDETIKQKRQEKAKDNMKNLVEYVSILWDQLYNTTNDIPTPLKEQWKNLRHKVEQAVEPTDTETPLNALSSFVFLRFICPTVLNPKLFYLTKDHQVGMVGRTLTLIAKILLTMANRSSFVEHKEPHLLPLNTFIDENYEKVVQYYDKITFRKLDFCPKILEMSDDVDRPPLNIPDWIREELPTMPYLIDKYLRLTELVNLIHIHNKDKVTSKPKTLEDLKKSHRIQQINDSNQFTIGVLEFEKEGDGSGSLFDDIEDDFGISEFSDKNEIIQGSLSPSMNNLGLDEDSLLFRKTFSFKELQSEASSIVLKTTSVKALLDAPQLPKQFSSEQWEQYSKECHENAIVDNENKIIYAKAINKSDVLDSSDLSRFLESYETIAKKAERNSVTNSGGALKKSSSIYSLKLGLERKTSLRKLFGKK